MPATKISNPRDLTIQLLGELLFVERRLAGSVIHELVTAVRDEELKQALAEHEQETKRHVERIEQAFRKLRVAPTSNRSRPFESAAAQHEELTKAIVNPRLADIFHAQAALHTEHWEMAAYRTLLPLLDDEIRDVLEPSLDEEGNAAKLLVEAIDRLAR